MSRNPPRTGARPWRRAPDITGVHPRYDLGRWVGRSKNLLKRGRCCRMADEALSAIHPELAAEPRRSKVAKMWDKEVAIDLRAKAEAYLLEHKPEDFERSARAAEERNQLRLEIARAYY